MSRSRRIEFIVGLLVLVGIGFWWWDSQRQVSESTSRHVSDDVRLEMADGGRVALHPLETMALSGQVISRSELEEEGVLVRRTLMETDMKYPLVVLEERLVEGRSGSTNEVWMREAVVADHLMVRFPEEVGGDDVDAWCQQRGYRIRRELRLISRWLIQTDEPGLAALAALEADLKRDFGGVEVERDGIVYINQTPNDPRFGDLWGLHNVNGLGYGKIDADIDAPEAWHLTRGSRSVKVAVIDTGVDRSHPDLAANMWVNPDEIPGNGVDDDGNGLVDDVHGWDFYNYDNDPDDEHGHGTHCAGTIGAVGNNGIGVVGVNWEVSIVAIRFLGPEGRGASSDAVMAMIYARLIGVDLTSNSWGSYSLSPALLEEIRKGVESNIMCVAAAGNDQLDTDLYPHYPSSFVADTVISVAASDPEDEAAYFTNYGKQSVDVAAPGHMILSTIPGGEYGWKSGTSMATPHVAGAVALLKGITREFSAVDIRQQVIDSADKVEALADISVSGGRLNTLSLIGPLFDRLVVELPESVSEDAGLLEDVGRIVVETAETTNRVFQLSSSDELALIVPDEVVLLAGETSAVFSVEAVDNELLDGTRVVKVGVFHPDFYSTPSEVRVHDTEKTSLSLSLPALTFEGAAPFQAAVWSEVVLPVDVEVEIEPLDETELMLVSEKVVIPAHGSLVQFELQAVDDHRLDGPQTVDVRAVVKGWIPGTNSMEVFDTDGAVLSLHLPNEIFEGTNAVGGGWVESEFVTEEAVEVWLVSSDTNRLVVPDSVVIEPNERRSYFDIFPQDNEQVESEHVVSVQARATNFVPASDLVSVLDDELMTLQFESFDFESLPVLEDFEFRVLAKNVDGQLIKTFNDALQVEAVQLDKPFSFAWEEGQFLAGTLNARGRFQDIGEEIRLVAEEPLSGVSATSMAVRSVGARLEVDPAGLTNEVLTAGAERSVPVVFRNVGNKMLSVSFADVEDSLLEGMRAYFPFDGSAMDLSGEGYHGTVYGATLTQDRYGEEASAYYFDGSNSYIECESIMDGLSSFTVSAWIRIDGSFFPWTGPWSQMFFRDQRIIHGGNYFLSTRSNVGNAFGSHFSFSYGKPYVDTRVNYEVPGGVWRLVTQTYDGEFIRQYDNEMLVNEVAVAEPYVYESSWNFRIGKVAHYTDYPNTVSHYYFNGAIDDLRIYERALRPDEVAAIYREELQGTDWWDMSLGAMSLRPNHAEERSVRFDAGGQVAGAVLSDSIRLDSNDWLVPENELPLRMMVAPPAPVMEPEPKYSVGRSNEVHWSPVQGEVSYWAEAVLSTNRVSEEGGVDEWQVQTNRWFTNLQTNHTYYYRVKAAVDSPNGLLESDWSDWVSSTQLASLYDVDGDQLPSVWEHQYWGDLELGDPMADDDGDGFSNLEEFISGHNPLVASEYFRIERVESSGTGEVVLHWKTVSNRVYCVSFSEHLLNEGVVESWESVCEVLPPINSYTGATHGASGFYKVEVRINSQQE